MSSPNCVAFLGDRQIAVGGLRDVARRIKGEADISPESILIFNTETGEPLDVDLRGSLDDVLSRLPEPSGQGAQDGSDDVSPSPRRGPGRPKLGVVAREVTLLPRHWDWLAQQPGGASVAIRKLVDAARKAHGSKDRIRKAQEATYRFASTMAGNRPNYEDAMRALFAQDRPRFEQLISGWPTDIRAHIACLATPAFDGPHTSATAAGETFV